MSYISETQVEVLVVGPGGYGGNVNPGMMNPPNRTAGGGGAGAVYHFFLSLPPSPPDSLYVPVSVTCAQGYFSHGQFSRLALSNNPYTNLVRVEVAPGGGGNGNSFTSSYLSQASAGGSLGHAEYPPDQHPLGDYGFPVLVTYGGGKGLRGGNASPGRTNFDTIDGSQVVTSAFGGGGGGAGGNGELDAEGRGHGGLGVSFFPEFKNVHRYYAQDLQKGFDDVVLQEITGWYAAGGASGTPGSLGGAGGGADAPAPQGFYPAEGLPARSPGSGGSGANNLYNQNDSILYGGKGGDSILIMKYPGLARAAVGFPSPDARLGGTRRNYSYYRNGYTYHVLTAEGGIVWRGDVSPAESILSPSDFEPIAYDDPSLTGSSQTYIKYANDTAPLITYGIWYDCLWQSSNLSNFVVNPRKAQEIELALKYFMYLYTANITLNNGLLYTSTPTHMSFSAGFVIPSPEADDAAVVTRVELNATAVNGSATLSVYGVARGDSQAKDKAATGNKILIAQHVVSAETPANYLVLASNDTNTRFKKVWLEVAFSNPGNTIALQNESFKVFGYPA